MTQLKSQEMRKLAPELDPLRIEPMDERRSGKVQVCAHVWRQSSGRAAI